MVGHQFYAWCLASVSQAEEKDDLQSAEIAFWFVRESGLIKPSLQMSERTVAVLLHSHCTPCRWPFSGVRCFPCTVSSNTPISVTVFFKHYVTVTIPSQ